MDNTNFGIVKESMGNLYEDRLLAYDLTYEMHNEVTQKRIMLLTDVNQKTQNTLTKFNKSIDSLITSYAKTELTTRETAFFEVLQSQFGDLQRLDKELLATENRTLNTTLLNNIDSKLEDIVTTLNRLSAIQLAEGKRQVINANRAIKSSETISKFEIGSMVIIGLLILLLIIYEPKL